jgi:hypothetical protein
MTEIPVAPAEPTNTEVSPTVMPTTESTPRRSRRGLIFVVATGIVAAVIAFVGLQVVLTALNSNAVALYSSEAEHYSVMAPGKPTQDQADLIGAITTTFTYWTDGGQYYSVSSTDGEGLPPSARGSYLYAALSGALKDAPGVSASSLKTSAVTEAFLAEPEEITLSGEKAFKFTLTIEGAPAPFLVVFVGHEASLYMLVYSESPGSSDEDFIDSFTFLG